MKNILLLLTFMMAITNCFGQLHLTPAQANIPDNSYIRQREDHLLETLISIAERSRATNNKAAEVRDYVISLMTNIVELKALFKNDATFIIKMDKYFAELKAITEKEASDLIYYKTVERIQAIRLAILEEQDMAMSRREAVEKQKETPKTIYGTGFFIDIRGYIATNHHVVDGAKDIVVEFTHSGISQRFNVELVWADYQKDLAILKIKTAIFSAFSSIPYRIKTTESEVGSSIFTLGFPMSPIMGGEIKFTDGKISSKTGLQGDITTYQISAPIQPGNSGGPLFDYDGNLIGITSSGLNRSLGTENVNYAIKSVYLCLLVAEFNLVYPPSEEIQLQLQNTNTITSKMSLTDKIKMLSDYVVMITATR
jgi:S1-C subfamily serine protease